jgi:hypothetical protein
MKGEYRQWGQSCILPQIFILLLDYAGISMMPKTNGEPAKKRYSHAHTPGTFKDIKGMMFGIKQDGFWQ